MRGCSTRSNAAALPARRIIRVDPWASVVKNPRSHSEPHHDEPVFEQKDGKFSEGNGRSSIRQIRAIRGQKLRGAE